MSRSPKQNIKPKYRLEVQQEAVSSMSIGTDQNLDVDQNNNSLDQKGPVQFKRGVYQIFVNDIYGVLKVIE